MLHNAHAGTRYGIPFPVLLRASFGTLGANVPALMRALAASSQCPYGNQFHRRQQYHRYRSQAKRGDNRNRW